MPWASCCGRFLDVKGRPVAAGINERAIAVPLEDLPGRQVVAVAGGRDKARAIAAVLASGVADGSHHRRGDRPRDGRPSARRSSRLRAPCINQRRPQGVLVMHDRERDRCGPLPAGDWTAASCCAGPHGSASAPPRRASCSIGPAPRRWPPTSTGRPTRARRVSLLLNKHPYADAMIADLAQLQEADRAGGQVRRLPRGRLFRQGHRRPVVEGRRSTTPS